MDLIIDIGLAVAIVAVVIWVRREIRYIWGE